jgi:hypothetical protein
MNHDNDSGGKVEAADYILLPRIMLPHTWLGQQFHA